MSHLSKTLIGATVVAGLALTGCGTSSSFTASNDSSSMSGMDMGPTAGMSQANIQNYNEWHAGNISHEFWNTQVVYHPEADVYFDPYSQTYYFKTEGTWTQSSMLPSNCSLLRSTRQVVDRREMLSDSGNAEYVMAFNPEFAPFAEDLSPLLEAADSAVEYSDRSSKSLSSVDSSKKD